MGILSDGDIKKEISSGFLQIEPFRIECVQPASYDIHLSGDIINYAHPADGAIPEGLLPEGAEVAAVLPPGGFCLASTVEVIKVPRYLACELAGKSTIGRMGVQIHATAGWIDPGFRGQITLEIFNSSPRPFPLVEGMAIGQLVFHELKSSCISGYGRRGHYQGQQGATPPAPYRTLLDITGV